ncbi:MAG: RidA family protein, partial [Candidatus Binatia bacterium]
MFSTIKSPQLFSEENLFASGAVAGEFAFLAQDGRRANGELIESSVQSQGQQTLANLEAGFKEGGLDLADVVSLMVYLPLYEG